MVECQLIDTSKCIHGTEIIPCVIYVGGVPVQSHMEVCKECPDNMEPRTMLDCCWSLFLEDHNGDGVPLAKTYVDMYGNADLPKPGNKICAFPNTDCVHGLTTCPSDTIEYTSWCNDPNTLGCVHGNICQDGYSSRTECEAECGGQGVCVGSLSDDGTGICYQCIHYPNNGYSTEAECEQNCPDGYCKEGEMEHNGQTYVYYYCKSCGFHNQDRKAYHSLVFERKDDCQNLCSGQCAIVKEQHLVGQNELVSTLKEIYGNVFDNPNIDNLVLGNYDDGYEIKGDEVPLIEGCSICDPIVSLVEGSNANFENACDTNCKLHCEQFTYARNPSFYMQACINNHFCDLSCLNDPCYDGEAYCSGIYCATEKCDVGSGGCKNRVDELRCERYCEYANPFARESIVYNGSCQECDCECDTDALDEVCDNPDYGSCTCTDTCDSNEYAECKLFPSRTECEGVCQNGVCEEVTDGYLREYYETNCLDSDGNPNYSCTGNNDGQTNVCCDLQNYAINDFKNIFTCVKPPDNVSCPYPLQPRTDPTNQQTGVFCSLNPNQTQGLTYDSCDKCNEDQVCVENPLPLPQCVGIENNGDTTPCNTFGEYACVNKELFNLTTTIEGENNPYYYPLTTASPPSLQTSNCNSQPALPQDSSCSILTTSPFNRTTEGCQENNVPVMVCAYKDSNGTNKYDVYDLRTDAKLTGLTQAYSKELQAILSDLLARNDPQAITNAVEEGVSEISGSSVEKLETIDCSLDGGNKCCYYPFRYIANAINASKNMQIARLVNGNIEFGIGDNIDLPEIDMTIPIGNKHIHKDLDDYLQPLKDALNFTVQDYSVCFPNPHKLLEPVNQLMVTYNTIANSVSNVQAQATNKINQYKDLIAQEISQKKQETIQNINNTINNATATIQQTTKIAFANALSQAINTQRLFNFYRGQIGQDLQELNQLIDEQVSVAIGKAQDVLHALSNDQGTGYLDLLEEQAVEGITELMVGLSEKAEQITQDINTISQDTQQSLQNMSTQLQAFITQYSEQIAQQLNQYSEQVTDVLGDQYADIVLQANQIKQDLSNIVTEKVNNIVDQVTDTLDQLSNADQILEGFLGEIKQGLEQNNSEYDQFLVWLYDKTVKGIAYGTLEFVENNYSVQTSVELANNVLNAVDTAVKTVYQAIQQTGIIKNAETLVKTFYENTSEPVKQAMKHNIEQLRPVLEKVSEKTGYYTGKTAKKLWEIQQTGLENIDQAVGNTKQLLDQLYGDLEETSEIIDQGIQSLKQTVELLETTPKVLGDAGKDTLELVKHAGEKFSEAITQAYIDSKQAIMRNTDQIETHMKNELARLNNYYNIAKLYAYTSIEEGKQTATKIFVTMQNNAHKTTSFVKNKVVLGEQIAKQLVEQSKTETNKYLEMGKQLLETTGQIGRTIAEEFAEQRMKTVKALEKISPQNIQEVMEEYGRQAKELVKNGAEIMGNGIQKLVEISEQQVAEFRKQARQTLEELGSLPAEARKEVTEKIRQLLGLIDAKDTKEKIANVFESLGKGAEKIYETTPYAFQALLFLEKDEGIEFGLGALCEATKNASNTVAKTMAGKFPQAINMLEKTTEAMCKNYEWNGIIGETIQAINTVKK